MNNDKTVQPLSYYVPTIPEEDDNPNFVLIELQNKYGLALEGLNKVEKLYLIMLIASSRCFRESIKKLYRKEIFTIMHRIEGELIGEEQEGLLEALIDGVRYQK
ncbi:hypothetical protein IQ243_09600 [Nostocales cyanobacterium LEGE 11386]|nr:hypothetical protein [Nostocales cyanobacterium LEGE 11386]